MPENIRNALIFLINTIFDLYLIILILRLVLSYVGANYFDPIVQFVTKCTDFIVKPLRRLLPNVGRVEIASLLLVLLLELIKFYLLFLLNGFLANVLGLLLLSFADTIKLILNIFSYGILLFVIMSWVQPMSPVNRTLYQIVSPILNPIRKIIPNLGGFDISPIPALLILQLLNIILVSPLIQWGQQIAFG